jgi:predicted metalloendopeptidase
VDEPGHQEEGAGEVGRLHAEDRLPDKWRDWDGLETSRDSYFGNVLAANAFNYKCEMARSASRSTRPSGA